MSEETFETWVQTHDQQAEDLTTDKNQLYTDLKAAYEKFDGKNNIEMLWRMSRGAYKAAAKAELSGNKTEQKKILLEAEEWAKKTIELDAAHPEGHVWFAFVCAKLSELVGVKERIQRGKLVQSHLEEAIKLKPTDSGLYYTYGRWCMEVAKLSWVERKLAATLFDTPPEATYEDAIKQFKEAERVKPGWKANLFFMGKSYEALKDYKEAIKCFDAAAQCESQDEEDQCVEKDLLTMRNKYASYR
ncbi:regulator of microtubule dynamics protein 2-like protein [Leptotrombidium deliense]|uniref:Regulator of microtubule dynamics protein 2-like protein n=1 Tax=Leptotrombidium deliense TaxID=299467 RepID=A0A443SCL0_9ACAR|nr:regulator of microtubule dynamics protein 2-like protein [Leptotrombidium deliense]